MGDYKTKGCIRSMELLDEIPDDVDFRFKRDFTDKLTMEFRDIIIAILNECYTVSVKMSRNDIESFILCFKRGNEVDYLFTEVYDYRKPEQSDITYSARQIVFLLKKRFHSEQANAIIDGWYESLLKDVDKGLFFYRS